MRRKVTTLALILVLAFGALAAKCDKSEHDQNIAWAKDINVALHRAQPFVIDLKPSLASAYAKVLPAGDKLITALEANDIANAIELLRVIVPIFTETAAAFTDNKQVLAVLALGDIGLHVLLNRLTPDEATAAAKKTGVASESIRRVDVLREYRDQQVWGCNYRPEKCKGQAVQVTP